MTNVILIGDSIRLGYENRVRELLGKSFTVYSPAENCRFTKYALWGMYAWMEGWGNPRADVIHWNTGIWDLHHATADGQVFTPLDEYLEANRRLAYQMESYSKNLIWATTIPGGPALNDRVKQNALINTDASAPKVFLTDGEKRWNDAVRRYNRENVLQLAARGVAIDDHHSAIAQDTARYISADGIHPSEDGYELLARLTAESILSRL